MKKFNFCFLLIFIFACNNLFCLDDDVLLANRQTAERCLNLAESSLKKSSYKNAIYHAELGLSYDQSISDLYYIKAAAQNSSGERIKIVLETISLAFEKNNWIKDNKNSARLLLADLLCETGEYQKCLSILNAEPIIFSSNAEFIRIKANYRSGDKKVIEENRKHVDSLIRLFPFDERFPQVFFMFESLYLINSEANGEKYEIPESVKQIAKKYISKFPDYKNKDVSMEVMASFFAEGENQERLLKAIGEKNSNSCIYAYAALRAGVISEEKAYNIFFTNTDTYQLLLLEAFSNLITDESLKQNLKERLNSFSDILTIDFDLDLLDEFVVKYERGRPQYISYDENNDEQIDLYTTCDFGVPLSINFNNENTDLFYGLYPCVEKVLQNDFNAEFYFNDEDFSYIPFEFISNPIFSSIGSDFFYPFIKMNYFYPDKYYLMKNAASLKVKTYERDSSYSNYLFLNGEPQIVYFYDGIKDSESYYAFALLKDGFPFVRYVDYDNDSVFETAESYDLDKENLYVTEEDKIILRKIYGDLPLNEKIYLHKVDIDRNNDTKPEFSEEYIGNGGKICFWDNDENGIWDYQFIIYPLEEGKPIIQDTIFFDSNGLELVTVTDKNGLPFRITKSGKELEVFPGYTTNYYWIENKPSQNVEKEIIKEVGDELNIGVVRLVQVDNKRYNVIKVGQFIYCKEVSSSDIELKVLKREVSE